MSSFISLSFSVLIVLFLLTILLDPTKALVVNSPSIIRTSLLLEKRFKIPTRIHSLHSTTRPSASVQHGRKRPLNYSKPYSLSTSSSNSNSPVINGVSKEPVLKDQDSYTKITTTSSSTIKPLKVYSNQNVKDQDSYTKPSLSSNLSINGDQDADIISWVDRHNAERALYGSSNLTWNPNLVTVAHQRALTCVFQHSPHNKYGENIAAGQGSIAEVLNDWANGNHEKGDFNPINGAGLNTHWTQMVWGASTEVGCCFHTCDQMSGISLGGGPIKFWVCEYHPAGNVIGQATEQVHAGPGGTPLSEHSSSYASEPGYASGSKHTSSKSHFRRHINLKSVSQQT
ncbi:hypothetical protein CROQUDRAFT_663572 [Cronartium quercuum f. sp. fusiforme G11]|uniref:SCP domain-containing protein n=1 Tax=Cronartium quercuum f. sp. fusiforme G11 TaxID=708437 RepID=A0A9P6NC96_9BASI|nr:hypothetical protein CROQUDRAFT_663572 [Cronartium quercuum f. sp. fusiforme G11]